MRLLYTCVAFVICSCCRRSIRIYSGSPLDPALHRNPFQYIDYDINEKPQAKKGVQPLMGAKTGPKAVKPLMSMNTRSGMSSEQKITDIASLVATMDKAAAEVRFKNRVTNNNFGWNLGLNFILLLFTGYEIP